MRGMIFTQLLDMIEDDLGLAVKDRVLSLANPAQGGIYAATGDYPATELLQLVHTLSEQTGQAPAALLRRFGTYMFRHFVGVYGRFFEGAPSCFEFLRRVESYIHVEVRKLYPGAELPRFSYPLDEPTQLVMEYHSPRGLAAFAEGLIRAAIEHFGEPLRLQVQDLSAGAGTQARFILDREIS